MGDLMNFISEAKRNRFSLISSIGDNDAVTMWKTTSKFIKKHMVQRKGVSVPGLGTFTFSQIKRFIGKNNVIIIQRPVFLFSQWFLQTHGLTSTKPCASSCIPVVPLNYTVLSNEGSYNRDSVELCIKEILSAMSRCLSVRKSIHLDFIDVGRVIIKDSKVQVKFFRDFIKQLDYNGELEDIFRLQTTQSEMSVMTNPILPHSSTSSDQFLPRITTDTKAIARGCSINSDGITDKNVVSIQDGCTSEDRSTPCQLFPRAVLLVSADERHTSQDSSTSNPPGDHNYELHTSCSHDTLSGQGLCYSCHQRNKKNIFIDVSDEKKTNELKYEKLLQEYQNKKHSMVAAKELDAKNSTQLFAKDTSLYNFRHSQKKRSESEAKYFHPSCIIQPRPPDKRKRQVEYCLQLDDQVNKDQQALKQLRERKEKIEEDQQKDLSKRLEVLKEAYSKEKVERIIEYRKALNEQIQAKSDLRETTGEIQYPVFGIHDDSHENPEEKQKSNQIAFLEHLAKVRERHQKIRHRMNRIKQEEVKKLKEAKQELAQDMRTSNYKKLLERKKLEESWDVSVHQKQQHLLSEKQHSKDTGLLLHDQCVKYKRCHQCQRHRENRGESNIDHRNMYILPDSRR